MNNENESDDVKYSALGSFSPREAERLLTRLRRSELTFRIEVRSSPRTSRFSGMGKIRSFVRIEIDELVEARARDILKELGLEGFVTDDEIERASLWNSKDRDPK
jgi:hypothetical protein